MDIIFLHDFRAKTRIGIYPWERKVAQTIQLDIDMALPDQCAAKSDSIDDAINYECVVECIHEILAKNQFFLLEALAEQLAHTLMKQFNSPWVKISIAKLGILRNVKKVGVCIERGTRK